MADAPAPTIAILRELWAMAGAGRLALLAGLTAATSLTEGIGLILLIPIAQLVAGDGGAALPAWLDQAGQLPLAAMLAAVVALVSLRALIVYGANEARRQLGMELARTLRAQVHGALMRAEWRWLAPQHSADHAALIIGETERAASLADSALAIASAAATLLVLAFVALLVSPALTLALALLAMPLALVLGFLRSRRAREGEAFWDAYARLQRLMSDGVNHLRAARIAGAEAALSGEFAAVSDRLAEIERVYFRAGHRTQLAFQIAGVVALATGLYLALAVWPVPLALLVPFLALAIRIVPLVGAVHQAARNWRYNAPAFVLLQQQVEQARAHREAGAAMPARLPCRTAIALANVSLHYAGRPHPVFSAFDLLIPAGTILGVTGPSGSGKSSLADLAAGLLAPDAGEVRIDGRVLDPSARLTWRRQVGYVEQDPFFLDASIADNLGWGRQEVSEEQAAAALRQAAAHFVFDLPLGLATPMGEGGRQFSGGELQRIALARALLAQPDLLILDEVSAGLDAENRAAIMRSIAALKDGHTVLLLSHDRELLALADRVLELGAPA